MFEGRVLIKTAKIR